MISFFFFAFLEAKKTGADSTTPEDLDINTIDKSQVDELLIPMPSFLKRRSLFETGADPDSIQIDVLGDDKICGSLSLSPEDLRMLVTMTISSFEFSLEIVVIFSRIYPI